MGYRYIGSKDKLSEIIISEILKIDKNAKHIIDLMAGTGLFSLALRENGFIVSALDVMTYSYHHLNFHLFMNCYPNFEGISHIKGIKKSNSLSNYELILNYLNELEPIKGYFYNEFSPEGKASNTTKARKYFTPENAAKIDSIRNEIKFLKGKNIITDKEHSLLIHDLIMATNDVANIAGTYGHYLSKFVKRSEVPVFLKPSRFSTSGSIEGHNVYLGYAEELSPSLSGDICYIDPPYIKRQYAANYHILETIAREDFPEAIGESGLRPWRDQYSNFCSKLKIRESFTKIIEGVNCKHILISYSEDGLIPINELTAFLSKFGKVSRKDIVYKRFKSNDSKKESKLHEYLIHVAKN
ncbi:DNA adenine methylase [Flavobacterium chungbukense]|uniref:site-specific DNA-methyltransferase (adenine-specific) n=1 Tax=Flavobacterium chungbukense TaxID=877464 RepID=A0ABP7YVB4_9FLAO|nr:DNA adenine methylase [Flavobacterium chungbukense]MCC4923213.1 DNA adenine methylase [Flavobacterium chungbukense]